MERWAIVLRKEDFKFSCAHFLIFPDGTKERLHGHNYRVACEIGGPLSARGLVIEFSQVKPVVRGILGELDEHWLLPGRHPELAIHPREDGHTEVAYRDCRYLAPTAEVRVLPVSNISVENLATWIGTRLRQDMADRFGPQTTERLRVEVSELEGQAGVWTWESA